MEAVKTHAPDAAVSGIGVVSLEAGGPFPPATMDAVPSMCSHISNRLCFDILLFPVLGVYSHPT